MGIVAGALDAISILGFGTAVVICLFVLATRRTGPAAVPLWFAIAAAASMTVVGVANLLNSFGITASLHRYEEYPEIMYLPLVTYMTYGIYAWSQRERLATETRIKERLDGRLADSLDQLDTDRLAVLQALSTAVDARDHYTALHSMHVADYACAIAYSLGIRDHLRQLEQAGLLHDIGKIAVPDRLLLKPAHLTASEFEVVKRHVEESAHIIETVPFFSAVVPMVRHHHERWDGSGYPDGLRGEEIPLEARILAVADAFDAMTTDRPYRSAMPAHKAIEMLREGRGSHFDAGAVDALVRLWEEGILELGTIEGAA